MINRILKNNLLNRKYFFIFVSSIFFVAFAVFLLISQRRNITDNSFLDEFFIVISFLFILTLSFFFINLLFRVLYQIRKKKVSSFNSKFTLYFIGIAITPAFIVGALALLIINFGVNDWFNSKIQNVINNSIYVAEGYLEEHKKNIKTDIYAMASDLDRNHHTFINELIKFENLFFAQSLIRNFPESYLIDLNGEILFQNKNNIDFYYKPSNESLIKTSQGEIALFTSTEVNKVYALINLKKFNNVFLYAGRSMDKTVLSALNETRSAMSEYKILEKNRFKISITFILIYLIITMILIFISILIGIKFAQRIVNPITKIIQATDNISKGNYDLKVEKTNDFIELNILSDSFNKMSHDIIIQRNQIIVSKKHEAWSEIAKKIAHEIKNPLTPIQLSTDRLNKKLSKLDVAEKKVVLESIDTIKRQVDEIKRLVDEFSNFARMPKPEFENHNLKKILNSSLSLFNSSYLNIKIKNITEEKKIIINCDDGQISRVINNIIKNAIFSINESSNKNNGLIEVKAVKLNEFVLISIKDNGKGFLEDEKTLLQPYYSTKGKKYGSGLGLSIVEKIINDHGGYFKIENNDKNEGVVCKFTIKYNAE